MANPTKRDVRPYEPLIAFANAKITMENWQKVQDGVLVRIDLWGRGPRIRLGNPQLLDGQVISGPEPLQVVQHELKADLDRLLDPKRDRNPPRLSTKKEILPQFIPPPGLHKDLCWLCERIQEKLTDIRLRVTTSRPASANNPFDLRVLESDSLALIPHFPDLRVFVYFGLAGLWTNGLLSRVGRCEHCQQFFLATTNAKKKYCSQRCAQNKDAAQRTKESRVRRIAWASVREDLQAALKNIGAPNKTMRQAARARGERALKRAEQLFSEAYPRREGNGYEEGKKFLFSAKAKIQRLCL